MRIACILIIRVTASTALELRSATQFAMDGISRSTLLGATDWTGPCTCRSHWLPSNARSFSVGYRRLELKATAAVMIGHILTEIVADRGPILGDAIVKVGMETLKMFF
ncbi:hypothetical protein ACLOJK_036873, partial [Asimina triloba]